MPAGSKAFVIGIAGPSGSGKTSLARGLVERLADASPVLLALDAYYRDLTNLDPALRAAHNFDAPQSLDHELMIAQVGRLARGGAIARPVYSFEQHARTGRTVRVEPGRYLIVEGLFTLYWAELRELIDLGVFLEADDELCLARRIDRDVRERGRTASSVRRQYERNVRPMCERYLLPTRRHADLILSGAAPLDQLIQTIFRCGLFVRLR